MDVNAFMENLFVAVGWAMTALIVVLIVYGVVREALDYRRAELEQRRRVRIAQQRPPLHVVRSARPYDRERDGAA